LITQKIHLPSPALRPYVAHYNFMSSDSPEAEIKLPPLIFSGFAFLFEGNLNITSSNGKKHANLQDWISPVTINPVQLSWPGKGSIISIQFWPGKFYDFFGWPQHLFFDDTVILEDTELEKEFFRLFEQLYEAPSLELKVKIDRPVFTEPFSTKNTVPSCYRVCCRRNPQNPRAAFTRATDSKNTLQRTPFPSFI
jgi:hypothetical protein